MSRFQRDGAVLRTCDRGWQAWDPASVSGPRKSQFDFKLSAGGQIFIVQLRAAAALKTLGVPMSSLANRFESLEAVLGKYGLPTRVQDSILGGDSELTCIRSIHHWLAARASKNTVDCTLSQQVFDQLKYRQGNLRIDRLAERVNISRRHLGRIIREQVGMAPKTLAKIVRFDNAVQFIRQNPQSPLAQAALQAGFADQSHMTREFRALAGIRPTDLRGPSAALIW